MLLGSETALLRMSHVLLGGRRWGDLSWEWKLRAAGVGTLEVG